MGKSIQINTGIPGPTSRQLASRKTRVIPKALDSLSPCFIDHGHGALVTDVDGNRFIDFTGGWGCLITGHTPESVVSAIREQAGKFTHTDFTAIPYEPFVALAERLTDLAPGESQKQAAFFNSGAEAIENAVKIARKWSGRSGVVVFEGAFHGRTLLTMTMTHKASPYKSGFGPFASDIYRVPYPNPYRNSLDNRGFERLLKSLVDPAEIAAIVLEPLQGEGGFIVPEEGFIEFLRDFTSSHGMALVADEIQTGVGRTGRFFAIEHYGVEPDLIATAKSLAAGLPLSAVIGKTGIFDSIPSGAIGGTYVGNPLACQAALQVLDLIDKDHLLERAVVIGDRIRTRFEALQEQYSLIGDVRGLGAMMGMELVKDRTTKEPAKAACSAIVQECLQRGVFIPSAGIHGNVLRMLLPLVITDDQLEEGLDVLAEAIDVVANA